MICGIEASTGVSAYPDDAAILEAIWVTLAADQDFEGTPTAWRAPAKFSTLYLMEAKMTFNDLESNGLGLPYSLCMRVWTSLGKPESLAELRYYRVSLDRKDAFERIGYFACTRSRNENDLYHYLVEHLDSYPSLNVTIF